MVILGLSLSKSWLFEDGVWGQPVCCLLLPSKEDKMEPESIEAIRKRFKDEWLLIKVTKTDELDQPTEGTLLSHSPDRDEIWRSFRESSGDLLVEFSGPVAPKGAVLQL
jgi:hypothetical protein